MTPGWARAAKILRRALNRGWPKTYAYLNRKLKGRVFPEGRAVVYPVNTARKKEE